MRCLSPRRAVVVGLSWLCVLVDGLLAPAQAEDHPFAVVTLASFDRVVARAASLGEAVGRPEAGDALLLSFLGGDQGLKKLFTAPALDTTRPIGIMSYPKWFSDDVEEAGDGDSKPYELPSFDDLFDDPLSFLVWGVMANSTVVFCFPAKDREQLLATIAEATRAKFTPIVGRPGWFEAEKRDDMKVAFVGRYVLLVPDHGKVKQWDRDYPDFEKLAKSSLGQNGFACSLYRRGLPKVVREDMAEAFKQAYAATLQRYDNEPEAAFKFRTMFGPLMTESLDLLLSQIEELRITGHVDSDTHQILVETELIGPKDGKLAKLANAMTTKSSLFANLPTDDALFAANVSLPLSTKLWKPVAESMRAVSEATQESTWLPEFARTLAKTIEAGQLELHVSYTNGREGLLALRVAGNPTFPEQFQAALETFAKLRSGDPAEVKLAADSVEGWPIHRVRASILDGELPWWGLDWSALTPDDARGRAEESLIEVKDKDGKISTRKTMRSIPAPEDAPRYFLWVAATPNGLWLALSSPPNPDCPAWFKSAIEASLAKPTATATATRSTAPVRLLLRGLGASPATKDSADDKADDAKVTQTAAKDVPVAKQAKRAKEQKPLTAEQLAAQAAAKEQQRRQQQQSPLPIIIDPLDEAAKEQQRRQQQQERERGDLLRDGANAIRVELRPTANGLRARTTFDDAYFHWFATMLKHSLDEPAEAEVPHTVEPLKPAPPPPPLK